MAKRHSDEWWMRRAIALAERGRGCVGTNPLVGAIVVRGGRLVGQGWHAMYGGSHAEAIALARAGERAVGATLYVTLEPCSRLGKTPPCTAMVVTARIRRVVVAALDPLERKRGVAVLRRQGIMVVPGVLEREAREQNLEFFTRLKTKRPFMTLKLAMTLDGKIADYRGKSKWISSPAARTWTRRLRSHVDAVMVGIGPALADDPRLTAPNMPREIWTAHAGRSPLKIIVDSRARTPVTGRMFRSGRVLIATTALASRARLMALRSRGAETLVLNPRRGRVPLRELMTALYARGVGTILCEGGSRLAGALAAERMVDRALMIVSPRIIGGSRSLPSVLGPDRTLAQAMRLERAEVRSLGSDTILDARVKWGRR